MTSPDAIRADLSRLLAGYFMRHLQAELSKPAELTGAITIEGVPFSQITGEMIHDLEIEFPALSGHLPSDNIFETWWDSASPEVPYAKSTFKAYNQGFLKRLLDLKYGTASSRKAMILRYGRILDTAKNRGRQFTFERVYSIESRMHELLRTLITRYNLPEEAWHLIVDQHDAVNTAAYSFFDEQLKASLKVTDQILRTILPGRIADRLMAEGSVPPLRVPSATVMFADIVDFTRIAESLSPEELVTELDRCFSHFDAIMEQNHLEKVKVIGDSYMCAGGILDHNTTHPVDTVLCALRIQEFMRKYGKSRKLKGASGWQLRIGIHTGPLAAGIIGLHRYNFDIWGDTVNVASRLEANGEPGRVNISSDTYEVASEFFRIEDCGKIFAKNKGEIAMHFVTGIRPELSVHGGGRVPNNQFRRKYAKLKKINQ